MKTYQQGDVVITQIMDFPAGERTIDSQMEKKILAYGEVTGHAHQLVDSDNAVEAFRILNKIYLNVLAPVCLRHEEHNPFVIPPGKYEIGIVRETDHLAKITRAVAD